VDIANFFALLNCYSTEKMKKRLRKKKYALGKLTDAWHGPFDELDSIGEKR
jgi:hypothetical protein